MSTSATLPADRPRESTRPVRLGVAVFLGSLALILLSVAVYFAVNATAFGTVGGEIPGTWGQAFKVKTVWPFLVWSALGAVAAVAGAYSLGRCGDDHRARLVLTLGVVAFGLAVFALLIPVYLIAEASSGGVPVSSVFSNWVFLWGVLLTGLFAIAGALSLTPDARDLVYLRVLVMTIGCAAGFVTVLLGFILPLTIYRPTIAKGLEEWRENWPAIVWPGLAIFGSLALMFAALQLGRGMERRSQNIRRLVYGFNAVLTGLLLLSVLSLFNVIAYAEPFTRFFGRPFDWTAGSRNSLSDATRATLADLKEPVKVYTILPPSQLNSDMQTFLDNCKSLTPKFTWESVSRAPEARATLSGMMEKYSISDPLGILILVGNESEGSQPAFTFIKAEDLVVRDPAQDPRISFLQVYKTFIGEGAMLNGLQSLLEGKMVIYLTQGHREWTADGPPPGGQRRAAKDGGKLSTLKQRLTRRRGVEVKTVTLDAKTKEIPPDASVVVIAHPESEFGKEEVAVLRAYLRRDRQTKKVKDKAGKETEEETVGAGRLMLLLEPNVVRQGDSTKLLRTGLEPLLAEYNVKLGENRILVMSRTPLNAFYFPMADSPNAIARAFDTGDSPRRFEFVNSQTVEPIAEQAPGKLVEKLLVTPENFPAWRETNFDIEPFARVQKLLNDRPLMNRTLSRDRDPMCIAVAVSDQGAGAAPRIPGHEGLAKDTPRMVVFGTASWLDNESLAGADRVTHMDLFTSSLSWLREKTAAGDTSTLEGKERKLYSLGLTDEQRDRVTFMPLLILVLGIFGMGMGVWVVRRR